MNVGYCIVANGQDVLYGGHVGLSMVYFQQKYGLKNSSIAPFLFGGDLSFGRKHRTVLMYNMHYFSQKREFDNLRSAKTSWKGASLVLETKINLSRETSNVSTYLGLNVGLGFHYNKVKFSSGEEFKENSTILNLGLMGEILFRSNTASNFQIKYCVNPFKPLFKQWIAFPAPPYNLSLAQLFGKNEKYN